MSIVMDEVGLNRLLRDPQGPVGVHTRLLAERLERGAKSVASQAGFRPRGVDVSFEKHPPTPYVRSGNLVQNLKARGPFPHHQGAYWLVGSDAISRIADTFGAAPIGGGGNPVPQAVNYPALLERGGISYGKPYKYPYLVPALDNDPDFVRAS